MNKINCICIGASKCGTTALYENLKIHPKISMPRDRKEVHFFNKNFKKGKDWYENIFKNGLKIDITPTYICDKNIAKAIISYKPEKIIIMLRDPIKRVESQYKMYQRDNFNPISFKSYVLSSRNGVLSNHYYNYIKEYLDYFKEKVFIIDSNYFLNNEEKVMDNLFDFLEIDRIKLDKNISKLAKNVGLEPRNKFLYRLVYKLRNFLINNNLDLFPNYIYKKFRIKEILLTNKNHDLKIKWDEEMLLHFEKNYYKNLEELNKLGINISNWLKNLENLKKSIKEQS